MEAGGQQAAAAPSGGWRAIAASRGAAQSTALVAILGRVRRIAFAEPTLEALREALAKQPGVPSGPVSFRVAADADGEQEVLTDEQLERLVRAGRPLHVLQEEPPANGVDAAFLGDGASSVGSVPVATGASSQAVEEDKTSPELQEVRGLLQELRQEAELANEALRERQKGAALERVVEELRQRFQAELVLEREAREAGEADLRRYADGLHGTALGVATRLEHQVASLQVQVEDELRAMAARSMEERGFGLPGGSESSITPQLRKVIDTRLNETLEDIERNIRQGFEGMLTDKIELIERTIRQDLLESSRAAHAELRAALDASRLLSEQQEAKRHGELEATLATRLVALENNIRKVDHSQTQTTCHLETMVKYVAAIQQDASRHDTEIKDVMKSVRELKLRTRAAVEGTLGLLVEAHTEKEHSSSERTARSQSPVWAESALGALAPLVPLSQLTACKPLDLLPGLPEMTAASTAEDDGAGSSLQDLSRPSLSSLASSLQTPAAHEGFKVDSLQMAAQPAPPSSPLLGSHSMVSRQKSVTIPSVRETPAPQASGPAEGPAPASKVGQLGSRGVGAAARPPIGRVAPGGMLSAGGTRRSQAADAPGGLRGISTDSGAPVRTPSNDTVYSNRSLPAPRRDLRTPLTGTPTTGGYAPSVTSPNQRPPRLLQDGATPAMAATASQGRVRTQLPVQKSPAAALGGAGLSAAGAAAAKGAW